LTAHVEHCAIAAQLELIREIPMPDSHDKILEHAKTLRETGHFEKSRAMLERLMAQAIRRHGRKAYESQCAMSQLGRTLRVMGRAEEASTLHWEVLAIRLDVYGRRGMFTINSAGILSETLRNFLHDDFMAAAVESWSAEPEAPDEAIQTEKPLTAGDLQQFIRARESTVGRNVARLVDEYLQRPLSERLARQ
jgi:hypothetical protein